MCLGGRPARPNRAGLPPRTKEKEAIELPIFEYKCEKCGRVEEFLVLPGEKEPLTCRHCGGRLVKLPPQHVGFVFKGSGFYVNDYKKKEEKTRAREEAGARESGTSGEKKKS